jgi:hypothetical protein
MSEDPVPYVALRAPMITLYCADCGALDVPVLTPGPSPHVVRASCQACGQFLKLLPRAMVRPRAPLGRQVDA